MYGLLIEAVIDVIKRKYGEEMWLEISKKCKLQSNSFSTQQQYSETLIIKITKCLSQTLNKDYDSLMEIFGIEFVNFVGLYGYDRMLRVLGRHMRDFLNGLDNLHEYMKFTYPKLKPPSFYVEKEDINGLVLHYRSKRTGFIHYVKGQIKQVNTD
jgi:guanylate cyclase, other